MSCWSAAFQARVAFILIVVERLSRRGLSKVGGIDLNKARMRWLIEVLIALCVSPSAQGFTASELARQVRLLQGVFDELGLAA
jgi:hypothetical protein